MYFRLVSGIIFTLSIAISASIINSDLTLPFDDPIAQDTLFPFDQTTLNDNPLDPPLDSTAPLFDVELSSTDALDGFGLSENPDTDPSELLWDDSFQLAGCSNSNIPPALGKSRVRRIDDTPACSNPASSEDPSDNLNVPLEMPFQAFDEERHSSTC